MGRHVIESDKPPEHVQLQDIHKLDIQFETRAQQRDSYSWISDNVQCYCLWYYSC